MIIPEGSFSKPHPDIFLQITKRLCFYEQAIIIPKVSKEWARISLENKQKEVALQALCKQFSVKDSVSQLKLMKFLKNNDWLFQLLSLKLKFYSCIPEENNTIIKFCLNEKSNLTLRRSRDLKKSKVFNLYWNHKNFELQNYHLFKKQNQCNYQIRLCKSDYLTTFPISSVFRTYAICIECIYRLALKPHKVKHQESKLISNILNFEILTHVKRLAHANLAFFSKIKTIDELSSQLYNFCDEFGRMIDNDYTYTGEAHTYNFIMMYKSHNLEIKNYLVWETEDLLKENYTLKDALRWYVLTETTNLLWEKFDLSLIRT